MPEERDCVVKLVDDHGVEHTASPGGIRLRGRFERVTRFPNGGNNGCCVIRHCVCAKAQVDCSPILLFSPLASNFDKEESNVS